MDFRSVVAESFLPDQFGFAMGGGGLQGRNAAPGHYGLFLKGQTINVFGVGIAKHAAI